MKRAIWLCLLVAGCSGPIPLNRAIQPRHQAEFTEFMGLVSGDPKESWYTWQAKRQSLPIARIRARDAAISTTRNPFNARRDLDAVSRGAVIFATYCARCHGEDARGGGPFELPDHPSRDFHAPGMRFAVTVHGGAPRTWFKKIQNGYGDDVTYPTGETIAMPAFGDALSREQIWQVITYLQSLDIDAKPADVGPAASG
jgi:mono/diheme cytochrome c family protein